MVPFSKTFMWLIFILFIFVSHAVASTTEAQGLEAVNGYTLKVLTDDRTTIVRLAEIICPSTSLSTFSCEKEAKQYLQNVTYGKKLTLIFWAIDTVGRRVCEAFLPDGTSLSELLVSQGYALQDRRYSSSAKINSLEKTAKRNNLGVWKYID